MKPLSFLSALLLTACVTINIYFPAAAAEKAADEIIKEIQEQPKQPAKDQQEPHAALSDWQLSLYRLIDGAIDTVISPAHAEADLTVDSEEIRRIKASMQKRFVELKPFYEQGWVGIAGNGMLEAIGTVPLQDKNRLKRLVDTENADRNALYRAIANANGQPDWAAEIKATFAQRWIGNAQSGWWYQRADGQWQQK